jgi:hypothetical protein
MKKLHRYSHLIFDKLVKNIQWRKENLFNKQCQENWLSTHTRLILDLYPSPCRKIHFRWIKDLNVRHEILKLHQEQVEKILEDRSIGNYTLNSTPIV